jgi:hypothetical protein
MKNKFRFSNYFLIVLFLLILISPVIQQVFRIVPPMENKENRKLSEKPEFNPALLDPYPAAFESWYNDTFPFRNQFVKLYADISFDWFNKSPFPDQVIIGSGNNLFMVPKELDTYRRNNLFTKEELEKIRSEFQYRKQYLSQKGIDYYVAVCPIKYSVYPEYLPWYITHMDTISRTDQFVSLIKELGINMIDLREVLVNAKDSVSEPLFTATDNHWNEYGSFFAYRAVMHQIKKKHPEVKILGFSDYNIKLQKRQGGNLAHILNMQDRLMDVKYDFTPVINKHTTSIYPSPYPSPSDFQESEFFKGYYIQNSNLPKILIIHDSFGKFIHPYFKDSFSRSVFIWDKWQYKLNEPIVEAEQPDIYVSMTLESLLSALADNCKVR